MQHQHTRTIDGSAAGRARFSTCLGIGLSLALLACSSGGSPGTDNQDTDGGITDVDMAGMPGGGGDMSTSGGNPEGNPLLNGITAAHNAARAAVMPAPSTPLPALTWSPTVAAAAQTWANRCMFQHSSNGYGENIYADAGQGDARAVVDNWVSEKANYNYAANTCSKVCGHYTQVVWRSSLRLGCAAKQCTTGSPFGSFNGGKWTFWVCDYDPPGNFGGQRPY
ncbi:MAG: Fis family transcriptional regulator [Myxococcales bacterium]|nr:Fis family transcriptional regulator [Myxococcales bacterium]